MTKRGFAFHALAEWLAAAWLVAWLGVTSIDQDMLAMVFVYLAFISLYELGYMANDLYAAKHESNGRYRGPQGVAIQWIAAWVSARILCFFGVTSILNKWFEPGWWSFFAGLVFVFALHNWLKDREMKVSTFAWLAWFRFMAPVIFVVQESQRMGIGLAAAMGYVAFRQLGYLDSKGLLNMPGRQRPSFRRLFFLMPLLGIVIMWPYPEAQGYARLTSYWAVVAVIGTFLAEKTSSIRGQRG